MEIQEAVISTGYATSSKPDLGIYKALQARGFCHYLSVYLSRSLDANIRIKFSRNLTYFRQVYTDNLLYTSVNMSGCKTGLTR